MNARLKKNGFATEVVVLETLYQPEKLLERKKTVIAFQENFKRAQVAQKLVKDIGNVLDDTLVIELLKKWKREARARFVVFSGFWVPIIEQYLKNESINNSLSIDLFHLESGGGASWRGHNITHPSCHHYHIGDHVTKTMHYGINIEKDIVKYKERSERILIHGGGWGIGTYLNKIKELEDREIDLDVVINDIYNIPGHQNNIRFFKNDPNWNPWDKNDNDSHSFCPFGEIVKDQEIIYSSNPDYPEIYKIIRKSKAVICKTGGGALLDSLSSVTPIIILESYHEFEHNNSLLWDSLGFGIQYDKWINSNCSMDVLEKLHENILAAKSEIQDYVEEVISCKIKAF
ncbi:MAG: hypothetical protein D3915_06365 [Candidatus Electrothrix sp. AU1_5]|nr:hypothetical protein [Candidatus Electrothrix gigas]